MTRALPTSLLLALAGSCTIPVWRPPGLPVEDSGTPDDSGGTWEPPPPFYDEDPVLDAVIYDCDGTFSGAWFFEVRTRGWAAGGTVSLFDTAADGNGAMELDHRLGQGDEPEVDYAENGEWDRWSVVLDVDLGETQAEGQTRFPCTAYQEETVTFRVVIERYDTLANMEMGPPEDCWQWGHDPEGIPAFLEADPLAELCTLPAEG